MARKAEPKKKLSYREQRKIACGGRSAGQPRTFQSGEEFLMLFEEFLLTVKAFGYQELPTKTNFNFWLNTTKGIKCNYHTINLTLNEYYSEIKSIYYQMLADTLSEGAALDKYKQTMIIFCLKNWCDWTDKQEIGNKDGQSFRIELDGKLSDWSK